MVLNGRRLYAARFTFIETFPDHLRTELKYRCERFFRTRPDSLSIHFRKQNKLTPKPYVTPQTLV